MALLFVSGILFFLAGKSNPKLFFRSSYSRFVLPKCAFINNHSIWLVSATGENNYEICNTILKAHYKIFIWCLFHAYLRYCFSEMHVLNFL